MICANCNTGFTGNFCPNCGQAADEGKINFGYFKEEISQSFFHTDKGFFYTLKMLFTKPGKMLQDYFEGRRVGYIKPIEYVTVMTAISTLLVKGILLLKQTYLESIGKPFIDEVSSNFFANDFSIFIFIMIPLASLVTWLFFRRKEYAYWEHFLANTYIGAQLTIIWFSLHLCSLVWIIISKDPTQNYFNVLLVFFMSLFLYLYGTVFGHLMGKYYTMGKLVLILTIMNFVLFSVYFGGFRLTGLIK